MWVLGQRYPTFALHRKRVTMLGRNSHPALRIESKCGRALKHPGILCFLIFDTCRTAPWSGPDHPKQPTKRHFFTLPPTLEDALFAVKEYHERTAHFL
jgi:hypothetical protein